MPVHTVPRNQLATELHRIARHEHVVTVTQDGDQFVIVTEPRASYETRLGSVTHAARIGATWDRDPLLHSFLTDQIVTDEVAQ
jgi:hypothetical protein